MDAIRSLVPRLRVVSQVQIRERCVQRYQHTTSATMAPMTMPETMTQPGRWKIHWTRLTTGSGSGVCTSPLSAWVACKESTMAPGMVPEAMVG